MRFFWQKKKKVPSPVISGNNGADPENYIYKIHSLSETGPVRTSNEDSIFSFYPARDRQAVFAIVADGMGGHNAGEIASSIACMTAKEFVSLHYADENIPAMLSSMMQEMHTRIRVTAANDTSYKGMGTTATSVFIRTGKLYYSHVGDSRLYCYNNRLTQISTDHTLVNQLVREGKITRQEAAHHDMKHVLMQALGTIEFITPEVSSKPVEVQAGTYYFLCSDGIYDVLSDEELEKILSVHQPSLALENIRAICYERRAKDNFSAVIVEIAANRAEDNLVTREQNVML